MKNSDSSTRLRSLTSPVARKKEYWSLSPQQLYKRVYENQFSPKHKKVLFPEAGRGGWADKKLLWEEERSLWSQNVSLTPARTGRQGKRPSDASEVIGSG